MSAVCFLDNDVLAKLVACGLYDEAIEILNLNESDLRVLSSAQYYFMRSKKAKAKYPESIRSKVVEIAKSCQIINPSTTEALNEVEKLQQYEGIDNGEALLIAATREEEYFWLITGDKRFLRTLASSSDLHSIVSRLQGRVICLEQLIQQLIVKQGFDKTLMNFVSAKKYDKSIQSIFGSGEKSTKDNVLSSLEYYIEDLRKDTKGMLKNI